MVARLVHSREWSPIAGLRGGADHASGHCANRHVSAIRRGNWRADKANLPSSGHAAARGKQHLHQLAGCPIVDHNGFGTRVPAIRIQLVDAALA